MSPFKYSNAHVSILALFFFIFFNSCKQEGATSSDETNHLNEQNDNATQEMIKDIKQRISAFNIESVPYIFNNKKVSILEEKIQSAGGNERLNLLFTYGLELLNAGKTEESIAVLNQLLQVIESKNVQSKSELIYYTKYRTKVQYDEISSKS